jgi:cholera toxin transcriptional activator
VVLVRVPNHRYSDGCTLSNVPAKRSEIVRFGVFEADLSARELRKSGRRLRLQDQPFFLLAALLQQPGTVVTREELRQRLWPADTFVDFDHSLNTAVNKLREVLGDSAASPRFIETLARRGYRFVAEVHKDVPREESPAKAVSQPTSDPWSLVEPDAEQDLPKPHRGVTRALFALIQTMYLVFYIVALFHAENLYRVAWPGAGLPIVFIAVLVTAAMGIPLRLYLLSGTAFDYRQLGDKFKRIFLGVLILDQLWAIAPFLVMDRIGFGPALGSTAALLYVPFAERTLIRMAYSGLREPVRQDRVVL